MRYQQRISTLPLLTCLAFASINTSFAEPYLGINVGGNLNNVSKDISYVNTTSSINDKYNGVRAQVLVGYNFRTIFGDENKYHQWERNGYSDPSDPGKTTNVGDMYPALEATIEYNSGSAYSVVNPWFISYSATAREELQYSGGIIALGKYQITPSVSLFLGPGISWGFFKIYTPGTTAGYLGVTGKFDSTLTGWTVKTGAEITVADDMRLVITYQYTNYDDIRWSNTEPLTGDNVTGKYKPVMNSLMLGIGFF